MKLSDEERRSILGWRTLIPGLMARADNVHITTGDGWVRYDAKPNGPQIHVKRGNTCLIIDMARALSDSCDESCVQVFTEGEYMVHIVDGWIEELKAEMENPK